MTKNELREKYLLLRQALSIEDVHKLSASITNQMLHLPIWNYTFFHVFLPIVEKKEVDTELLLPVLLDKEKTIAISKSNFKNGTMSSYFFTENTRLKTNKYGIPEPLNGKPIATNLIDVVFIPLLAFDLNGHRIGYGKGFYDRFLKDCRVDVLKIGVSFFEAESPFEQIDSKDIPLDYCVTPKRVYRF